jgi:hypothetical protein
LLFIFVITHKVTGHFHNIKGSTQRNIETRFVYWVACNVRQIQSFIGGLKENSRRHYRHYRHYHKSQHLKEICEGILAGLNEARPQLLTTYTYWLSSPHFFAAIVPFSHTKNNKKEKSFQAKQSI